MKKLPVVIYLFLLFSASSGAVLPPQYLSVPKWQSCVGTVTKDSAQFICLPMEKPENCLDASWQSLRELHEIEDCPPAN